MIDLTQTVTHHMQVYPGDTPPVLIQTCNINNDGYTNHVLTTGMHAGTHIDGPWHMIDSKSYISDFNINRFVGDACIIDISEEKEFNDVEKLKLKVRNCGIILFYTGYGSMFGTDKYTKNYPVIGTDVAHEIVKLGISLIGLDSFGPDMAPYKTHQILLSNGVLIAENLTNLQFLLNTSKFKVIALPLKISADSAPARVIAIPEL